MLNIGLMLDSTTSSAWVAQIVQDIQQSSFARITFIIRNTPPAQASLSLKRCVQAHWRQTLFHKYEHWDYLRNRGQNDSKAPVDLTSALDGIASLQVQPIRKGFTDRFSEVDLATIREQQLDVIFRFGFRIIRGPILSTARYGVWSFHHDDNREYRGGPPLFWEVFEGNPVSGAILQILTDSLDGGQVLYRGLSSTDQTSLYRNRNAVYWRTAASAIRTLHLVHSGGHDTIRALPTYTEQIPYTRGIYRTPNAWQMTVFAGRLLVRSLRARVTSRLRGGHPQWFLALRPRSVTHPFSSTADYRPFRPPMDRFYADPFLFERKGTTYLFFEDLPYRENRAFLSCCELSSSGKPGTPFEVLRRPYHLSYPFIFEHAGEVYMIPETKENRTVELYRATEFPRGWALAATLLTNIHAVDATIHQHAGKLWMFVGMSNGRFSNSDELGIFFADHLLGPWTPHPGNPVLSDVRRARPAGKLFVEDGKLIRPSQDCGKAYGYALNFSEVLTLNETEFREQPIARINPDWLPHTLGTHTYNRSTHFEVIDGNRSAKVQTT